MQINHNLSALFVNRQLKTVESDLQSSTEKLATGMRINRAGDDATNLSVSERMRTQIKGLRQAERNALNGMSFIQVAEGNLSHVNTILQRLRELAVQSANGIYSQEDRRLITLEVSQMIGEVNRLSTTAQFNRLKLLTGDFARQSDTGSMFFHVGPNQDERIRAYIPTMNARAFGLEDASGVRKNLATVQASNEMIGTVDAALDKVNQQRADLGAYYNRIDITLNALRSGYENMNAAESRLRDTDMAEELVEFTKNQILLQSGTAMLAQSNFSNQTVLQLLDKM